MDGIQVGRQTLRVTKSNKTIGVAQIFDILGAHLKTTEDAHTRCPTIDQGRKIRTAEQEKEDSKKAAAEAPTTPIVKFKPAAASRQPNPGPNADHYAGYPGNGAPLSRSNPNWPQNPNMGWSPGPHHSYYNPGWVMTHEQ